MKLKTLFIISLIALLACDGVKSQSGVAFQDLTWEQALKEAQKQNKFLFVDVVRSVKKATEKTGQDRQVDQVLSVDSIAGLINDNFLSIKMDMGSEEGKTFGPKLQMLMYPAYVFYNTEGDQIGNSNSYELVKSADKFLDKVYSAIQKGELKKKNNGLIEFLTNGEHSWENVLEKAAEENKPIFVDVYTTWCRPCIQMDRDIFTLNEVSNFYNKNFINLKLDGGKNYGPELAKKYGVNSFPTFLYIDDKGKLIHSASGFKEKEVFLKLSREALKKFDAKTASIDFLKKPFEEVQEKAKSENKPIFFDAYTTWCGPCKQMDKEVFTNDEVAELFNKSFVNAKFDMEKGEGTELKEKYSVNVFPTYLFLDADGSLMHRITGALPVDILISEAKKVLDEDGETSASLDKRYASGDRSNEFLLLYIKQLNEGSRYNKAEEVASIYLNTLDRSALTKSENWKLFNSYIRDPYSDLFSYFLANTATFKSEIGEQEVSRKLNGSLIGGSRKYFLKDKEYNLIKFDKAGYAKYIKYIKDLKIESEDAVLTEIEVLKAHETNNWADYVNAIEKGFSKGLLAKSGYMLYNYAIVLNNGADVPKKFAYVGAEWVAECMVSDPSPQAQNNYLRLYAELLEKSGNKKDAEKARQQIN